VVLVIQYSFISLLLRRSTLAPYSIVSKMADNKYIIEYSKTARSKCKDKLCGELIAKDVLRIGKIGKNPFREGETKTDWFHAKCIFSALSRARATTKKIDGVEDIAGFEDIDADDQAEVKELIAGAGAAKGKKRKATKKKKDDSDDEDGGEKKKAKKKASKKDDDDGDDDAGDEKKKAKKKAASPSPKKKKAASPSPKKKKSAAASGSDEDGDGGEDDDDDDAPKKKKQKTSPAKSKAKSKSPAKSKAKSSAGSKQYFEMDAKFWEISVNGDEVTTRYGKTGTNGQTKTKDHGSAEKAQKAAQKAIKEKTGKGYEEQS